VGTWDVHGMLRQMPARQWQGWKAYHAFEKFGPRADNLHAAITAKAVYDTAGVKRKDGTRFDYEDFILVEPEPREPDAPQAPKAEAWQMSLAIAHVIARAQNHIASGGR
jgi:hypothetical protein